MQHSSAAAKLIRQMFRQDSHHNMQDKLQVWLHRMLLSLQFCGLGREEARPEAILSARRLVCRPSWRKEARREAILSARRPVCRPSWASEEPFEGCLGRQEARLQAVLAVRRPEFRFYCSFAAKCRFCAAAGRWLRLQSSQAAKPNCTFFV